MRIAIIGIGALGSLFAARLSSLADVTMLGHWSEQLQTLQRRGLTLIEPDGTTRHLYIPTTSDAHNIEPVSIVFILVKSYQTARAAGEAKSIVATDGLVVTLQNGLGNKEEIAASVGLDRTVLGTTTEGATIVQPGLVRHAGSGMTYLASESSQEPNLLLQLTALLNEAGFTTTLVDNVDAVVWDKLAVNAAINPLTALLCRRNGYLSESEVANRIMSMVAQEVGAVAEALEVRLPPTDLAQRTMEVVHATARNVSSMLQDILANRPTEIDAINGAIIRLANKHEVSVPANRALLQLLELRSATGDWFSGISKLPGKLQPLFFSLYEEANHDCHPRN